MTYLRNKLYALGQVQSTSLSHIYMIPGAGFVYLSQRQFDIGDSIKQLSEMFLKFLAN